MRVDFENAAAIAREIGLDEHGLKFNPIGGGDIADTYILQAADAVIFLKVVPLEQGGLLSAEADGLSALRETRTVRVPGVIRRGVIDQIAWLALEHLQLDRRSDRCDRRLGEQLAQLHRTTDESFGWRRNNYIGHTPQSNRKNADWGAFYAEQRLGFQFDRLANRHPGEAWADLKREVIDAWHRTLGDHRPEPALIHGDLWRGNAAAVGEQPVIFDPAVHYADRECDLAMADLFGGFAPAFYESYRAAWPLPEGADRRRPFYKLYHLLNHANLFGGGYLDAAGKLCHRLISD